jgi:hypothetical protein
VERKKHYLERFNLAMDTLKRKQKKNYLNFAVSTNLVAAKDLVTVGVDTSLVVAKGLVTAEISPVIKIRFPNLVSNGNL